MSNVAALKKKAAEFEQRKLLDKAIVSYREILDLYDAGGEENVDVGLYNRVADLLLRQGATPEAVTLFERAVDLYTEGGFFNNAIALCNKILRTSPGRASVYYKLGKISAAKGFNGDAKQNFLEYADRMQKSGQMQEAFRALKEFADLCPDQDDIRLLLAEQLTKADKKGEALEQLQLLYARYDSDGRTTEAQATVERMKSIDPFAEARSHTARSTTKSDDDLVFLDLSAPVPRMPQGSFLTPAVRKSEPTLPLIDVDGPVSEGVKSRPTAPAAALPGLEFTALSEPASAPHEPLPPSAFAELDLQAIPEAVTGPGRRWAGNLVLPGELPAIEATAGVESTGAEVAPRASTPWPEIITRDLAEEAASDGASHAGSNEPRVEPKFVPEPLEDTASTLQGRAVAHEMRSNQSAEEQASGEAAVRTTAGTISSESAVGAPQARRTSSALAASADVLAERLQSEPTNWALHRQYAEALLEGGDREGGLKALEKALSGFEKADDLDGARAVADEIIRLKPSSVRFHQKRVEYAFRSGDKVRLAEAYVELADALFRDGQSEKAKVVYQRVLEIAPTDVRARTALDAYVPDDPPAESPQLTKPAGAPPKGQRYTGAIDIAKAPAPATSAPPASDDGYVSLGDWLREEEGPKSTRMVVDEEAPTGDEQKDFDDMLRKFKQGVADNVEDEDHASHYDLGVAYKEMGLIDEAIAQFQKAFRGTTHRVRTYEALGQCFVEKKQLQVAITILQRALHEPSVGDEQLIGVLYLLGYVNESIGKHVEAKAFYERVFGVDIQFRDVGERLSVVEKALA